LSWGEIVLLSCPLYLQFSLRKVTDASGYQQYNNLQKEGNYCNIYKQADLEKDFGLLFLLAQKKRN
jgi:hypothetical protein